MSLEQDENVRIELGKIDSVYFGIGGYNDAMLGIHLTFKTNGGGCGTSKSMWDPEIIECSRHSKWTEEDRTKQFDEITRYVSKLLRDAKVKKVEELKNKPVEVSLVGNTFKSFRILTEVL